MINLTPRLKAIADMVTTDSITDVGTDHGKLPIYLALSGKIIKAIASDLNQGPIDSCVQNINKYGVNNIVVTRLSDGLLNFKIGETKTLCIAGMGGELISTIISNNMEVAESFSEIILQPMTQIPHLKAFLYENGFTFIDEILVKENEKIYDVFKVKYDGVKCNYKPIDLYISDLLIKRKDSLLYKYTCNLINRYETIIEGITKSGNIDAEQLKSYSDLLCEVKRINEITKDYQ